MAYTKLDSALIMSSVWREPLETKVVWITLLAMKNINGEVRASIPGLAHTAGVSIEKCEEAIATLLAPDPYSGSPKEEGRRITPIEKGWHVVNHILYQALDSDEDRKQKAALRQKRYRDNQASRDVTVTNPLPQIPHADADADAEGTSSSAPTLNSNSKITCTAGGSGGGEKTASHAPPSSQAPPPHPDSDSKKVRKSKRFGTLDELQLYAVDRGLPASDGEFMFDHCEARGWTLPSTGKPLKCWRAHFRTYQSKSYLPSQNGSDARPAPKGKPRNWKERKDQLDDEHETNDQALRRHQAAQRKRNDEERQRILDETPDPDAMAEWERQKKALTGGIGKAI